MKWFSQQPCVLFSQTQAQSPSDCCWMTQFSLSKVPCDWRKGTIAVSWWVWLRLIPGSSLCLPIQGSLIQQRSISLSANLSPLYGALCTLCTHSHWEAGALHTILISQCECVCVYVCVANWQHEPTKAVCFAPWMGKLFIDIFCG